MSPTNASAKAAAQAAPARDGVARKPSPPDRLSASSAKDRGGQTGSPETRALNQAADACNAAFAHITKDADDVDLELAACVVDCAQLCATTAAFIARGSEHADNLRAVCAEVAKCVEESCEESPEDVTLTACADACRDAFEVLNQQGSPRVG